MIRENEGLAKELADSLGFVQSRLSKVSWLDPNDPSRTVWAVDCPTSSAQVCMDDWHVIWLDYIERNGEKNLRATSEGDDWRPYIETVLVIDATLGGILSESLQRDSPLIPLLDNAKTAISQ